ncbi:hexose transporter [Colletotrichum higginsianum]|nr:hexose transporter [Colletotrichum higginsianum]
MDTVGKVESHSGQERLAEQAHRRRINDRAVIDNPLADYTDDQLEADVRSFAQTTLHVDTAALLRAARVGKDIRLYDEVARNPSESAGRELPVQLTAEEKRALASFNGSSLYDTEFGLDTLVVDGRNKNSKPGVDDWKLGAANASPFFFAAILGCPLALPVNHYLGRKGGMVVAAFLILVSSLASAFATNWQQLFGIRLVNGIGEHNDDSLENKHH